MAQPDPGGVATDESEEGHRHATFEDFWRDECTRLVKVVVFFGATLQQAEDAVGAAMADVYPRFDDLANPYAYTKKAALRFFIKAKTREKRLIDRVVQQGMFTAEVSSDDHVTVCVDHQWLTQILMSLPRRQRDALACHLEGLTSPEIAQLLGGTPAAARKNLQLALQRLKGHPDVHAFRPARRPAPAPAAPIGTAGTTRKEAR